MNNKKIGFIGFGLIGGSIAKALKKNNNVHLIAYDYTNSLNTSEAHNDLVQAKSEGILDNITSSLKDDFSDCQVVFLCAPVLANIDYLPILKEILNPDCIITDVGSVKGNIHNKVEELGLGKQFIGGHPMTGSEKTGYQNSYSMLLENAYYILTPTKEVSPSMVEVMLELVKTMGSIPVILDATEHDIITAAISHVPHIIAAQLVNLVKESDDSKEHMRALAAGGFKDITRIASSSPTVWQNISLSNAKCIKKLLDRYIETLKEASDALSNMDGSYLYNMFDEAGEYRNSIPNKSIGLMKKTYELYVDIVDEAGSIASIATLLAANQISIKNIGIIHNREFEEGVLRIEFYDDNGLSCAINLLEMNNYNIYKR
jgi:prephenate dehydrogenase